MASIDWSRLESTLAAAPKVIAAWVFGSAQSGQIKPGSDVDVGVLFESKLSLAELLELTGVLQQVVPFAEIDLVPLNEANPIPRFEAISGRAIFCRDAGRRAEFASLTAREYEDEMAMVERWVRQGSR
ncbi:MAG: nucleotidyltransferase domain-containing protein [Anaerolineae bacterium]|nr:nucleotidyltransferase domain-containing protein [Anaerolineales bacterium]MCQ3979225.1 nucleotidyltransferase domain-containing protein [Anaerolineae bacterium]